MNGWPSVTHVPTDAQARAQAVAERERNVLIDAGAGTGKTTLLVERLVQLVAPVDDGPALSLDRIAAITFTRRAAGELRLRVRRRIINALGEPDLRGERRKRLRAALSVVDTAHIGTIHSFADRLLRIRPVQAQLGPSYEVVDDRDALVAETARVLLHGASRGTLAERLDGVVSPALIVEAAETITNALTAGLLPVHREYEYRIDHGIDTLVRGFVEHRDIDVPTPDPWLPDDHALRNAIAALVGLGATAQGESPAARWLRRIAARAQSADTADIPKLFADVVTEIHQRRRSTYKFNKKGGCLGDSDVWRLWNRLDRGEPPIAPLADDVVVPLHRWMASRLLRLRPVVLALYEDVKRRHGVLDEIDLLLLLRNLVRDDAETRAFYQARFDHVFVDEFQDTDPLQAEIVLYLAERGRAARSWEDVVPAPGRITIVGDPQQSIYRFRRADVVTYADVCERLADNALRLQLSVNFRGTSSLVEWTNDRFREVFGVRQDGARFDPGRGRVFHRDLEAGRADQGVPSVHLLPFESEEPLNADEWRAIEGRTLPRYLHWLVEQSSTMVFDTTTEKTRPVAWGDICVLAMSTVHLPLLFRELDAVGIPYAASGGTLFLEEPLQQCFILALRAISDPTDGPAAAALRRPPFFSVDLRDLFRARGGADERRVVEAMEAMILDLRRNRFSRSAGETARALLERTCLGAAVAVGPNGAQRLERLRELCHLTELLAITDGLDYDGVTARMREWIRDPEPIDAPPPVTPRAVRVMTIHAAKGLEFPVVVLWDGRASAQSPENPAAWQVSRDGQRWMITLDGLRASQPIGIDLGRAERALLDEERRRLSYVAVTRARDLLVIPRTGEPKKDLLWRPLSDGNEGPAVRVLDPYVVGRGAPWAATETPAVSIAVVPASEQESRIADAWREALASASRRSTASIAVTTKAHALAGVVSESDDQIAIDREGRYGSAFGTAVHRAIGLVVTEQCGAAQAVERCFAFAGATAELAAHAERDVERAIGSLRTLGLLKDATLRLEYAIAGESDQGDLLVGAIDLVALHGGDVWVIDFKTDNAPTGPVDVELPGYAAQVRLYGELLRRAGICGEHRLRCALLFTADGSVHEVAAKLPEQHSDA